MTSDHPTLIDVPQPDRSVQPMTHSRVVLLPVSPPGGDLVGGVAQPGSPFDALRRADERGEFWLAREIVAPLGYTWRGFTDAVERGRTALRVNDQDPDQHIEFRKASSEIQVGRPGSDFRMTREGVYATIQGADPRKPQIAAAWAYFRVRTRQAEQAGGRAGRDLQRLQDLVVGVRRLQVATAGLAARLDVIEQRTGLGYTRTAAGDRSPGQRVAGVVMRALRRRDGWVTRSELRRCLPSRDREHFDTALARLRAAGQVNEQESVRGVWYRTCR
jgi:hypothetical protein